VCNFRVINNRRKRGVNGEWADDVPLALNVTAWGDLAEHVAASVDRGDRVLVEGRLTPRSWEKDGVKHHVIELTADEVAVSLRFAESKPVRQARQSSSPPQDDDVPPF
jgi:single-strand DNA-binding protein